MSAVDPAPRPAPWTPSFPRIRRLDDLWYRAERGVCGVMFLVMALMVFGSLVQESFADRREPGDVIIAFGIAWLAVASRRVKEGERRLDGVRGLVAAAALTAIAVAVVLGVCWMFEGNSIMIQKLALVMMIWVALLGASMATHERSHLTLELGEKVWPARVLPFVRALAHGITSVFCVACAVLSVKLVVSQRDLGLTIEDAPWLGTWQAFLIVPYAFAAMAVRYLAQSATLATGTAQPPEERMPS